MNELVQRLSEGEYPIEVSLRPEKTATAFKESIDHRSLTMNKGESRSSSSL